MPYTGLPGLLVGKGLSSDACAKVQHRKSADLKSCHQLQVPSRHLIHANSDDKITTCKGFSRALNDKHSAKTSNSQCVRHTNQAHSSPKP